MANITGQSLWSDVPEHPINAVVLGGPGGVMNTQAQALANRIEFLKNSKAPLENPTFTGFPTAPTFERGNSSQRIATTEFVAKAMGNMREQASYSATTALTVEDTGRIIHVSGGGNKNITLPPATSCPNGSIIYIGMVASNTTATINLPAGSVASRWGGGLVLSGALNETAIFYRGATSTAWSLIGGTAIGKYKHTATSNGYMYLDNGLIYQWGSGSVNNHAAVSFPITFPTLCMQLVASERLDGYGAAHISTTPVNASTFHIYGRNIDGGFPGPFLYAFMAIGY